MIYWCKKCKTPVFDKGLHSCSCDGKMKKISEGSICNPVFKQERKLLEKIMDCDYGDQSIWYLGASKYFIDEQIVKVTYRDWYKAKKQGTSVCNDGLYSKSYGSGSNRRYTAFSRIKLRRYGSYRCRACNSPYRAYWSFCHRSLL